MKLKAGWALLKETVNEFVQDRCLRLAAATAYYAVFSIGPLLVLVVGLAGLVFGENRVAEELGRQLRAFVGEKSARMIQSMMSAQKRGDSLLATIMGGAALVIGATGAFGQLQDSLNTIWGVTTKPGKSTWAFLRARFFSMTMVLGIGFLLLVSMILTTLANAFANYIGRRIALPAWIVPAFNSLASFLVISVLFALIFKVLPDVRIRWRDVRLGALATALLFEVGKFALGRYLAYETSASAYGAGTAFVAILLYVYYSSIILYFGAELTKSIARQRGARVEPSPYAVRLTDHDRVHQGMPTDQQIEEAARRADRPNTPSSQDQPRRGANPSPKPSSA